MRKGGDRRGSSRDRKRRKLWMLATFDPDLGDSRVRCHLKLSGKCERVLDYSTVTADRIVRGSSYARDGLQPSCQPCQNTQGGLARHGLLTHHDVLAGLRETREADQAHRFAEALRRAR